MEIVLHYYQFNIGDYRKDTVHLSRLEHSIYRDLIDWYYLDESPIPVETQSVSRRLRLASQDEQNALIAVLNDFFTLSENGWTHKRIDADILDYHEKCHKNRKNGQRGGRPSKEENPLGSQSVPSRNPTVTLTNNHKPITNNQEPVIKTKTQRGSRLPADQILLDDWALFCKKERPDLTPSEVFLEFKDYWIAQPGQKGIKTDWDATWRNWVRRQNAKKKGSVWDENERRKQQLADRIFGKRSTDDGRTIEAATVRLG